MSKLKIKVGEIYWDCAYHPVLCTESKGDDVVGISLFNGSGPRSCSIMHCVIRKLNAKQVRFLIERREKFLETDKKWHEQDTFDKTVYNDLYKEIGESKLFD